MCLHKAGVRKELLETVKAKKLAYYGPPSRNKRVKRDNTSNNAGVRITKSNYITPKKPQIYSFLPGLDILLMPFIKNTMYPR